MIGPAIFSITAIHEGAERFSTVVMFQRTGIKSNGIVARITLSGVTPIDLAVCNTTRFQVDYIVSGVTLGVIAPIGITCFIGRTSLFVNVIVLGNATGILHCHCIRCYRAPRCIATIVASALTGRTIYNNTVTADRASCTGRITTIHITAAFISTVHNGTVC